MFQIPDPIVGGFQLDINNVIIQWGRIQSKSSEGPVDLTFPITFSTSFYVGLGTSVIVTTFSAFSDNDTYIKLPTLQGMSLWSNGGNRSYSNYIVIGY